MTVLVTGGAGYIGSHMVHALVDAEEQIVVLHNLTTGFDWAVPSSAKLAIGDAGDQSCVAALIAQHRVDTLRAGSDRDRETRVRRRFQGRARGPPGGRRGGPCRRVRPCPFDPQMA